MIGIYTRKILAFKGRGVNINKERGKILHFFMTTATIQIRSVFFSYVIATEEGIADNFSSAVVYGMDGRKYKDPELIQSILDIMAVY